MKWDFADLIPPVTVIHSIKTSLCQGLSLAKQELIRELLMGFHRCPPMLFPVLTCLTFSSSHPEKPVWLFQSSKGKCSLGIICHDVCDANPSLFWTSLELMKDAHSKSSTMLREANDLPKALGVCWMLLCYLETWPSHISALALSILCAQCRERCLQEWFGPFGGAILFLCWPYKAM